MTKTNLLTVFVVTFVVAMLGVASVTPVFAVPVNNPANGHHYEFIQASGLSWTDAKNAAEAAEFLGVNGHLVTITSAEENAFVDALVPSIRAWIGLTDAVTEGTFEWVTGEPVIYTNFGPGEPNDNLGAEDVVEILATGFWNDVPDSFPNSQGYVVEYDIDPAHSETLNLLNEILDEVKEIWNFLQDEVLTLLLSTETTVNNINNEITDPEHGLAEIKNEIRSIEQKLDALSVPSVTCGEGTTLNTETNECEADISDPKVDVCHKGKNTLNISISALPAHLDHGDTLGTCE